VSALLDPGFVRELEALRRRMEVRARSGAAGEHIAKRRGGSAEFHEHRTYAAGDDLRRIDWSAYARSGEPVVKVFRAEEDVVARLLLRHLGLPRLRRTGEDRGRATTRGRHRLHDARRE